MDGSRDLAPRYERQRRHWRERNLQLDEMAAEMAKGSSECIARSRALLKRTQGQVEKANRVFGDWSSSG
jgi:hypothetical protein